MTSAIPLATKITITLQNNFPLWQPATWEDYLKYRDDSTIERVRLYFNNNYLLVDMGSEGINHSTISDLFTLLLGFWFSQFTEKAANSMGRCLMEKAGIKAASPDLVLYIGDDIPQWQLGKFRKIDLNQWRIPDLVGEISDTTLATDLDEKKQIYANLEIPEYWVIDVQAKRVIAFLLQENGKYQQFAYSEALKGLPITLLEETLKRLSESTNISAANWFNQAIANLNIVKPESL